MFSKIKQVGEDLGVDKKLAIFIIGMCCLLIGLSVISGKPSNDPIIEVAEEIIEDVIEAETGIEIDINGNETKS